MKQALDLRQGQKLTMTPQLQQAVKLLQMSASELSEDLQYARETNPLPEMKDESDPESDFRCEDLLEPIEDNLNAIDSGSGAVAEVGEIDITQLQFDQLSDPDKSIWDDPRI